MEKKFIGLDWTNVNSGQTVVYSNSKWVSADVLSASTTIGDLSGYTIGEINDNFLSANTSYYTQEEIDGMVGGGTTASGNDGNIQFNSATTFYSDTGLSWDNSTKTLNIGNASVYESKLVVKADSDKTIISEFIDDLESPIFEIYKDGSIRLYDTIESITNEGSIWLDTDTGYLKLYSNATEYYLNIDKFVNQRDIEWVSPTNGDVMVWNADDGVGRNQHSEDFDLIKLDKHINITSDTYLIFEIPAGYKMTTFVINEIVGANTGNIYLYTDESNSGTTGLTLIESDIVEGFGLLDCTIYKGMFSFTEDTPLYIVNDNWTTESITVYAKMEKIIN